MIPLGIVAGAVGQIASGAAKKKAAKKALQQTRVATDEMVQGVQAEQQQLQGMRAQDQADLQTLRAQDEARLRDATGYDLGHLRDQALAAGFNPLTVLQMTGGAGYDGRGAVLQTPFESRVSAFESALPAYQTRAELVSGAAGGVASTAGFVGDAISAASSAFLQDQQHQQDLAADVYRTNMQYKADMAAATAMRGTGPFGGTVVSGTNGPVRGVDGMGAALSLPGYNVAYPDWLNTLIFGSPQNPHRANSETMQNEGFGSSMLDEAANKMIDLKLAIHGKDNVIFEGRPSDFLALGARGKSRFDLGTNVSRPDDGWQIDVPSVGALASPNMVRPGYPPVSIATPW